MKQENLIRLYCLGLGYCLGLAFATFVYRSLSYVEPAPPPYLDLRAVTEPVEQRAEDPSPPDRLDGGGRATPSSPRPGGRPNRVPGDARPDRPRPTLAAPAVLPTLARDGFESGSFSAWRPVPLSGSFWTLGSMSYQGGDPGGGEAVVLVAGTCGPGFTGRAAAYRLYQGRDVTAGSRPVSCEPRGAFSASLPLMRGAVASRVCVYVGIHGECQP